MAPWEDRPIGRPPTRASTAVSGRNTGARADRCGSRVTTARKTPRSHAPSAGQRNSPLSQLPDHSHQNACAVAFGPHRVTATSNCRHGREAHRPQYPIESRWNMSPLSALSRRTNVPVRTLRSYQELDLLPTLPEYDESHVRRVALVKALLNVGGLPHAEVRRLVRHVEDERPPANELLRITQHALPTPGSASPDQEWEWAQARVSDLIRGWGWQVSPDNPAWQTLCQVTIACKSLGHHEIPRLFPAYAEHLERIARLEVQILSEQDHPESAATSLVAVTALGDVAISALRRLAHEHFLSSTGSGPEHSSAREPGPGRRAGVPPSGTTPDIPPPRLHEIATSVHEIK
ncbi:MerR family transcriptional regulator [Streptomyces sp. NPDC048350]|uniref:MerR family transcriptional regulator n=1 Tax=Streptomyces sp. NPDC048350 TaxID=3365538 RepID=UPI003712BDDE